MSAQISDFFSQATDKEKNDSSNFRDTLNNYLYHWPLFIIALGICIAMGFVYLQLSSLSYTIKATVIIKDDKKESEVKERLDELNVLSQPKLAENELEVFKSRNLITQVVNDLQLFVTYRKKVGLKSVELYKSTPVTLKIIDTSVHIDQQAFKIKIKDKNSFYLVKQDGSTQLFNFNSILKTGLCTWKLTPTINLNKFKGDVITIIYDNIDQVEEQYQDAINAELPNKLAPIIALSIKDGVLQRGKDILNDVIRFYDQASINAKNRTTLNTLDFLDKRISALAGELNNTEDKVEDYRSSVGLTDISSQSKVYLENVQSNDNKLNEVNIQLNIIESIEQSIRSAQNIQNASASLGLSYPALNSLIEKLSTLQSQREKLLATTPEGNPMFEPIDRQMKGLRDDIKANIQNIKSSLTATRNKLQSNNTKFESSIRTIPTQERQLVDKTRQQSIKQALYASLLERREQVGFNYASIVPDAKIVDYPYTGSVKASRSSFVYSIAILFGLLIPSGFIYGRNVINNRVKTRKEIESATGATVMNELSYVEDSSGLVELDKSGVLIGEEFRALRTSLHFLNTTRKKGWVTLLTSSISSEGKSFVSSNLGLVLAASGKKTVLLEMDLRKPRVSGMFGLSASHPGISSYLTGESTITEIIQASKISPHLDIIGSGPITSDPSELLGKPEVDTMFDILRASYDYIVIDTPPINLVTDARILSRFGDVTLYVVRQGYTYQTLLPFIRSLFREGQFPDMKIIFNSVEKGRYGYGYNYGNEYYQELSKTKKDVFKSAMRNFLKRF